MHSQLGSRRVPSICQYRLSAMFDCSMLDASNIGNCMWIGLSQMRLIRNTPYESNIYYILIDAYPKRGLNIDNDTSC